MSDTSWGLKDCPFLIIQYSISDLLRVKEVILLLLYYYYILLFQTFCPELYLWNAFLAIFLGKYIKYLHIFYFFGAIYGRVKDLTKIYSYKLYCDVIELDKFSRNVPSFIEKRYFSQSFLIYKNDHNKKVLPWIF